MKSPDLSKALEHFSFSRLPKRERIAQILAEIFVRQGVTNVFSLNQTEGLSGLNSVKIDGHYSFLNIADHLAAYASSDFTTPYAEPELATQPLAEEFPESAVEPAS